ncbi:hypothetical protein ACP4OV_011139 [Aristida adscensionis]
MPSSHDATCDATAESSRSPWCSARPPQRRAARACRCRPRSTALDGSRGSRRSRYPYSPSSSPTLRSSGSAAVISEAEAQVVPRAGPYHHAASAMEQAKAPVPDGSENQAHFSAEPKHLEKLRQSFVALAKIVPGDVRKRDKPSLLGDTIRYVKQLQDRVKALVEEARSRRRWPDDDTSLVTEDSQLSTKGDGDDDDDDEGGADSRPAALPEIEAQVSDRTVRVKIQWRNRRGALVAVFSELERMGLAITTANVLPFAASLDITIVAMVGEDFCLPDEDIVQRLDRALKSISH